MKILQVSNYNNILKENYTRKTRGEISDHLLENNFVSQSPEMRKMRTYQDVAIKALIVSIIPILLCTAVGTGMLEAHFIWGLMPLGLSGGGILVTLAVVIPAGIVCLKLRKQLPSETEITNLRNEIYQSLNESLDKQIADLEKSIASHTRFQI